LIILLAVSLRVAAQVAVAPETTAIFGQPGMGQQAPNALLLGWGTGISYDSNALNSQPHTGDVQYTFYPLIGLTLARPRWGAVLSFAPGLAYSTANLPQYQAVSFTSTAAFNYQASERLSFGLSNNLVSSSNPFNSLTTNSTSGQNITNTASTAVNYLPRTNESALVDAAYNTSARSSLVASMSYNYINYQHNSDIANAAQPFQTSTSTQASMGLRYSLSPKFSESMLYVAQFLSAGPGMINTLGQSIQYGLAYAPKSGLRVSGMIGPEFVENTYGVSAGDGKLAKIGRENTSMWTWTGNVAVRQTLGKNQLSANASRQLTTGTQYQGNVRGTTFRADFSRPLARKTDLAVFGSYNINQPVFLVQLAPRLSNNYASTGATLSRTIAEHWLVSCAYWYLFQNAPQSGQQLYSGDHSRVAVSLTYSLTRALPQ
jgi:hypothetical protein